MKSSLSLLLGLSLLLTACNGGEPVEDISEDTSQIYTYTYKTAEFEMEVPSDWELIDEFTSEYPDGLKVAFRNNIKDSVFTANLAVLKEENREGDTSFDFAQRKLQDHEDTLLNYKLLEQEIVMLKVGGAESKSSLSTFEGKNETSGPALNFMQVTLTKGENAWTATATYRKEEDESIIVLMKNMLRSFNLQ